MRFYSIFGAVLRKFIANVVVLRFYNTKRFNFNTVFRNFRVISMRFSYVFLCCVYTYFWRFCGIRAPLTPPIYDVAGFSLHWFLLRGVGVCAQAIKSVYM